MFLRLLLKFLKIKDQNSYIKKYRDKLVKKLTIWVFQVLVANKPKKTLTQQKKNSLVPNNFTQFYPNYSFELCLFVCGLTLEWGWRFNIYRLYSMKGINVGLQGGGYNVNLSLIHI